MKFRVKWRYFSLKYTSWNTCYDGTWILCKHLAPFPVNLQVVSATKRDPNYAWISIENRENLRIDVPIYFCFCIIFQEISWVYTWRLFLIYFLRLKYFLTGIFMFLSIIFSAKNLRITSGYELAPLHANMY